MWKSCSRATKPPLQIKLYSRVRRGGKATRGEGEIEEEREKRALQRENKALRSGTSSLCQTIMRATGDRGRGERECCMGEKEAGEKGNN